MAAYKVTDWSSSEDSYAVVLAEIEVKLETLDSTTNVIRLLELKALPNDKFVGVMVYDIA